MASEVDSNVHHCCAVASLQTETALRAGLRGQFGSVTSATIARERARLARLPRKPHVGPMSASFSPAAAAPVASHSRIASIDLIRGAVMVLMAIDHVRVYSGLPAGGPTAGIFFTRWVTHFVAPAFIFLAGTSAFFYGRKHTDLSRFLFIRGVWLVLLELTVIRIAWTFNFDFTNYMLAGVIWVIGWCMILMAALVRLRPRTVGLIGVVIIALHNAVMLPLVNRVPALGELWKILYIGFFQGPVEGTPLIVLYSIIPWIGVMAAGYWCGSASAPPPCSWYCAPSTSTGIRSPGTRRAACRRCFHSSTPPSTPRR